MYALFKIKTLSHLTRCKSHKYVGSETYTCIIFYFDDFFNSFVFIILIYIYKIKAKV